MGHSQVFGIIGMEQITQIHIILGMFIVLIGLAWGLEHIIILGMQMIVLVI